MVCVLGIVVADGVAVLVVADVFVCWAKVGIAKLIASPARVNSERIFIVSSRVLVRIACLNRALESQAIDSLKDFLQEISERRPPDEHAVGSGHDGVDMFDFLRAQLAIKLLGRQSTHPIVIAGYDLEKAEIFIDLIRILNGVFELITKLP